VTGRDDPVGVHDRAAAAERAAAQPSCIPAPLVGTGVLASDDVRVGAVTADGRGACYQSENDEHLHDCLPVSQLQLTLNSLATYIYLQSCTWIGGDALLLHLRRVCNLNLDKLTS
jgi:hypothetical protein